MQADDNIVDTGLASLGTTSLISIFKSRDERVRLTPAELIACVTVADIAELVDRARQENAGAKVTPLEDVEDPVVKYAPDIENAVAELEIPAKSPTMGSIRADTPYESSGSQRSSESSSDSGKS